MIKGYESFTVYLILAVIIATYFTCQTKVETYEENDEIKKLKTIKKYLENGHIKIKGEKGNVKFLNAVKKDDETKTDVNNFLIFNAEFLKQIAVEGLNSKEKIVEKIKKREKEIKKREEKLKKIEEFKKYYTQDNINKIVNKNNSERGKINSSIQRGKRDDALTYTIDLIDYLDSEIKNVNKIADIEGLPTSLENQHDRFVSFLEDNKDVAEKLKISIEEDIERAAAAKELAAKKAEEEAKAREEAARKAKAAAARKAAADKKAAAARKAAAQKAAAQKAADKAAREKAVQKAKAEAAAQKAAREKAIQKAKAEAAAQKAADQKAAREKAIQKAKAEAADQKAAREKAIQKAKAEAAAQKAAREKAIQKAKAEAAAQKAADQAASISVGKEEADWAREKAVGAFNNQQKAQSTLISTTTMGPNDVSVSTGQSKSGRKENLTKSVEDNMNIVEIGKNIIEYNDEIYRKL